MTTCIYIDLLVMIKNKRLFMSYYMFSIYLSTYNLIEYGVVMELLE